MNRSKILLFVGVFALVAAIFFWTRYAPSDISLVDLSSKNSESPGIPDPQPITEKPPVDEKNLGEVTRGEATPDEESSVSLNSGNFKNLVPQCFQGAACELSEDPWKMYRVFKLAGDHRAMDDLIAFLRRLLSESEQKEKYRDILRRMIEDFYPPREKQFQLAAYYAYLGDLKKSLALYLDLEKRSQNDSSLRKAPPLNIANVLYDMGRYRDALPYYKKALDKYHSGERVVPSTDQMIDFVQSRIESIQAKSK